MSQVFKVFQFDFQNWNPSLRSKKVTIAPTLIEDAGARGDVCNAVVFWFELQLNDEITVSTSPYGPKQESCRRLQAIEYAAPVKIHSGNGVAFFKLT